MTQLFGCYLEIIGVVIVIICFAGLRGYMNLILHITVATFKVDNIGKVTNFVQYKSYK